MTLLSIIGFASIALVALYVTAAAVGVILGEWGFGGQLTPVAFVLSVVAACLWVLVFWLNPVTITLGA